MTKDAIRSRPTAGRPARAALVVVLFSYFALALAYGAFNPLFEAPDELWHFLYIDDLQRVQALPVQSPAQREAGPRQEGSQPPLYYLLAAALTAFLRHDDLAAYQQLNNRHRMGESFAPDERNVIFHTEKEDIRYSGTARAVHLVRLLSTLLGALTVLLTFAIAREVLPSSAIAPPVAAALVAFLPQFDFLSGAVNNDNLGVMAATLSLWLLLRARRQPSLSHLIVLGLACGVAALAKLSALSLAPVVALGILTARGAGRLSRRARYLAVVAGVALVVAGWWYARNLLLYGDPLGLNMMLAMVGRREAPLDGQAVLDELWLTKASFWAFFGWMNVPADNWFYLLTDLLMMLGLAGFLLGFCRAVAQGERPRELWLLIAWIVVAVASFANWNRLTVAPQGRLLFTALAPSAILAAWGTTAFRIRGLPLVAAAVPAIMAGMAAYALPAYLLPSYHYLPIMPRAALDGSFTQRAIDFGGQYRLLGFRLEEHTLRPGQTAAVALYWQRRDPAAPAYVRFLHLEADGDSLFSGGDAPLGESLPPAVWSGDDVLREECMIAVPANADAPLLADLTAGLYTAGAQQRLAAREETGAALGDSPQLTRLKIIGDEPRLTDQDSQVSVPFGGEVALVGYRLASGQFRAGRELSGTLYWRALAQPRADYTVFVHLAREGKPLAQYDGQPRAGRYPTSVWLPGELVRDHFTLQTTDHLPPGEYHLLVGLYDLKTGRRLSHPQGTAADLGVIVVLP